MAAPTLPQMLVVFRVEAEVREQRSGVILPCLLQESSQVLLKFLVCASFLGDDFLLVCLFMYIY